MRAILSLQLAVSQSEPVTSNWGSETSGAGDRRQPTEWRTALIVRARTLHTVLLCNFTRTIKPTQDRAEWCTVRRARTLEPLIVIEDRRMVFASVEPGAQVLHRTPGCILSLSITTP